VGEEVWREVSYLRNVVVPVRMPSGGEVRRKERPIEKGPVGHASTRLTTR
jgi:hypothetical protein